jgi:hypothetical protein
LARFFAFQAGGLDRGLDARWILQPVAAPSKAVPVDDVLGDLTFPGRSVLYVHEVADKLRCCQQHILDLIDEGRLPAIEMTGSGNKTARRSLRIPAAGFRLFLARQRTDCN